MRIVERVGSRVVGKVEGHPGGSRGIERAGARHLACRILTEDGYVQCFVLIGGEADLSWIDRNQVIRSLRCRNIFEIAPPPLPTR